MLFNAVLLFVAAATAAPVALTVLACCTGIRSIRTAYLYRIMPSCRRLLCYCLNENELIMKQNS